MNAIEPWKAVALVILFCLIAAGINSQYDIRVHLAPQPSPRMQSAQTTPPTYVVPTVDTQRQNAEAHAKFLDRYVNHQAPKKSSAPTFGLVVISESGVFDNAINAALSRRFKDTSNDFLTAPMKPAFVSDGLFNATFNGSQETLQKLGLEKMMDALILGRETVEYTTNPSLENVLTATMQLEVILVPISGNGGSQTWKFLGHGAGFKQSEARTLAEERIIKQIESNTQMKLTP